MLFSSSEVADYINATFEPAWESVRPVPIVTIDFGNGRTIKRTLQGNIATYVCGPDGTVYDLLPGIYTPAIYRRELEACEALAESLHAHPEVKPATAEAGRPRTVRDLADSLRAYHTQRAAMLVTTTPSPQMRAIAQTGGGGKFGGGFGGNFQGGFGGGIQGRFGGIEGPTQWVIAGLPPAPAPTVVSSVPLAAWPELALDSQVNELIRRRAIHERLAGLGAVRPDDIKQWLFKEVLHADLDDPLLGLGGVLNENYPFIDEDRAMASSR